MKAKRAVLDTNILVAAARSRNGASHTVLRALRERQFTALASVPLMLEYEAILHRPEQLAASNRTAEATTAFLDALALLVEPVTFFYLWRPQTRDPADEMVLETALNGRADCIVTHNVADFHPAAARFRLAVLTPAEFLQQLREE
jgi:putative PIN family toxin of toxin-antitoxin system